MKPILLEFNKQGFDTHAQSYADYLTLLERAKVIFKEIAPDQPTPEKDFTATLHRHLENHPLNWLKTSGAEIAQKQGINLTELEQIEKEIPRKHQTPPDVKDYSVYAENKEEETRFNVILDIITAYKKLCELEPNTTKTTDLQTLLKRRITLDWNTPDLVKPNINYVKNG